MKKLINNAADVVKEMLEGLAATIPNVQLIREHKILVRRDINESKQRQVSLISGGGSGHEPAHAGYIGSGCLSAAVCGEVFSSPSQEAVLVALRVATGPKGALLIVKNYTGDKINFRLAAEEARTKFGLKVGMVVIGDDVALLDDGPANAVGARGLAGVVFLHKILGAYAEAGTSLKDLVDIGNKVAASIKTMGVALTPCTVPALGKPTFFLGPAEMEVGLGIHGEHGISKQDIKTADEVTDMLLDRVLAHALKPEAEQKRVVVLVNDLGSLTHMELAIVSRRVLSQLDKKGIVVERIFTGDYLTSLEMSGVSITILPVDDTLVSKLDQQTAAPAWRGVTHKPASSLDVEFYFTPEAELRPTKPADPQLGPLIARGVKAVCDELISNADLLTTLDSVVGDGDLGSNLLVAAKTVLADFSQIDPETIHPAEFFIRLAEKLKKCLGGTSGPMYSIFFMRLGEVLGKSETTSRSEWIAGAQAGIEGIKYLGDAQEGDRTMLDALIPAIRTMSSASDDASLSEILKSTSITANESADATAKLIAKRGRSSYLRERVLGHVDPGAKAVAVCFSALANAL